MVCQLIGQRPTFILMIFLTTSFFLVEIIVGYTTNSMALVADSFHMLSDIISLFVGFFALKLSRKTDGTLIPGNTFGWVRAEVLGALINAVFLVALCLSILISALKRLIETEPLNRPILILIVGAVGLVVNLLGMLLFHGHAGGHGHSHGGHGHSHGGRGHGHGDVDKKQKLTESKPKVKEDTEGSPNGSRRKDARRIENVTKDDHDKEHDRKQQQQQQHPKHQQQRSMTTLVPVNISAPPSPSMVRFQERARSMQVIFQGESSAAGKDLVGEVPRELVLSDDHPKKNVGQMNMRGVYLHILGDALGSVIVIIAALIVHFVKQKWTLYVDPCLSIIMVGIILYSCIPLLKESSQILLQNVPQHIQLNQLETKLLSAFPEIVGIHEFHVWQLTGNKIIASVHVKFHSNADYNRLSPNLKEFFHSEGIHSTTFQPEVEEQGTGDEGDFKKCLLACESKSCQEKLCCTSVSTEDDIEDEDPTNDAENGVDVKIIVNDVSSGCQDNDCFQTEEEEAPEGSEKQPIDEEGSVDHCVDSLPNIGVKTVRWKEEVDVESI